LDGGMALRLMILLLVLKLVAVAASYASGNAGGIFGPSLFLGAMLGGIVGNVAHGLFPSYVATPGAYALVGMGTAFAGIVRAPMTSVVMIFEITRDYAVIVPLMISNLVSFFISARFQKQPIYEVLAHQDGIHLPTGEARQQAGLRQVIHALRPATEVWSAEMTVQEALEKSKSSAFSAWPVRDKRGVFGVVRLQDLKHENDGFSSKRLSEIVGEGEFPHVHSDHSLHMALDRMGASQLNLLPVVSRANVHQLEGVVTLQDVLRLYGVSPKESM
jgi:CIC family chloride channel protein